MTARALLSILRLSQALARIRFADVVRRCCRCGQTLGSSVKRVGWGRWRGWTLAELKRGITRAQLLYALLL